MQNINQYIRYIGAEDDDLLLFEGQYPINNGISYNSYFIEDERTAVMDAVDVRRCSDWLSSLSEELDRCGRQAPDYLIVQHMEPDHAGCIGALIRRYPTVKVVCTAKAVDMLANYFEDIDFSNRCVTVGDGDILTLGRITLRFITAPMVHWPEVMVTFNEVDGVLFSADAFGSFAMSEGADAWDSEARRYYTNIVGRFGSSVQMLMKKIKDLKFGTVAPLHGPLLTQDLAHYWTLYDKWSRYEPECKGVLVAYASVYGGTAEAARQIAKMLREEGAGDVVLINLCNHDVSYAVSEAFRLGSMVLCSVTYDGGLFPAMHTLLHHLEAKKLCNRRVGLIENGSWAPMAGRHMRELIEKMKGMDIVSDPVTIRCRMHESDIADLRKLAQRMVVE